MNPGMAGEDAALDGAVASIAAKLRGESGKPEQHDMRENREDRDVTDVQSSDLEESERLEREAAANEDGERPEAEAESEDGKEPEQDAEAFIELPPAEDGGEPERVAVTEAVEAVKQLRQMNGEIATAVIKAEEEAFTKQAAVTQAMETVLSDMRASAQATLQMMQMYAPQKPHPDDFHSTEDYYKAKLYYDSYADHYNKVLGTVKQAESGTKVIGEHQDQELVRRETDRASRFIPEFKDEKTRATRKSEILGVLAPRYGVTKGELDEVVDHKAWRIMNDLANRITAEKKAPEVKRHLQETKPKIVNGRVNPERDRSNGQFIAKADKELREKGTEDAFARKLLRSGALKGF